MGVILERQYSRTRSGVQCPGKRGRPMVKCTSMSCFHAQDDDPQRRCCLQAGYGTSSGILLLVACTKSIMESCSRQKEVACMWDAGSDEKVFKVSFTCRLWEALVEAKEVV
jgi:hypothetical protein